MAIIWLNLKDTLKAWLMILIQVRMSILMKAVTACATTATMASGTYDRGIIVKKYGYVRYESDYFGDYFYFIVRCCDGVSLGEVLHIIRYCPEYDLPKVLLSLGAKCGRGSDMFDAISECQCGNVRYWVDVFHSDYGISISLVKKESDICHNDVLRIGEKISDDYELPF